MSADNIGAHETVGNPASAGGAVRRSARNLLRHTPAPKLPIPDGLPDPEESIRDLDFARRPAPERQTRREILNERKIYEMEMGAPLTDTKWRKILRAAENISLRNAGFGLVQALAWIRKTHNITTIILEDRT